MNLTIIPPDSCLTHWCRMLSCTEIPISYQVTGGITLIGALLRRQVWIDQKQWKVYPNQPVMFVGPSGIGKDTIINRVSQEIDKTKVIPTIGGKTMEGINQRLEQLGQTACCYISAGELSSFFGNRDYQSGMIQDFTNLLSTGDKIDVSTKGSLAYNGKPSYIHKPTITLHGGTTEEWLHKAMPDGTMEGGFLGRFLVIGENFGRKHVALIKNSMSRDEMDQVDIAEQEWDHAIQEILEHHKKSTEMYLTEEAQFYYTNWYHNRFKYFSHAVLPYANRSRDMVLRLAMLMAVSRQHWNWIEEVDVKFGAEILIEIGRYIDKIILPPTSEAQASRMILMMLPATSQEIWKALNVKFPLRVLQAAEQVLSGSGQIYREKGIMAEEGLVHEIPPYTPTGIVGAKEVWDAGGRVYVIDIVPDPDGAKYSTSGIIERILNAK